LKEDRLAHFGLRALEQHAPRYLGPLDEAFYTGEMVLLEEERLAQLRKDPLL
jgi:hypothetical protein